MKIGVGMRPAETRNVQEYREMVVRADGYGVARLTTGDGQERENFAVMGMMATLSKSAQIGATMVNPVTRDIGVVGAGLATLNYLSEGRAFLILARGDGAVRNLGYAPATVDATRAFFLALRDLLRHDETVYKERHVILRGTLKGQGKDLPLGLVAEGPRMLHLAGQVADVVQVGVGLTAETIQDARDRIAEGARSVGRNPAEISIWWGGRFRIGSTREEAMELSLTSLASMGNHALRGSDFVTKKVPPELHDRLRRYHKGFDYDVKGVKYEGAKHGKNIALMEDLGLTDYFLDRFGVVGTPEDIVDRLHYLETLGVEQIGIAVHRLHDLRLLGEKVLPAFM